MSDPPKDCYLCYWSDADYADGMRDSYSTSGGMLILVVPRTFVPLNWLCKKQTAVSRSSTEAEMIALDARLRMEALPALILWEKVIEVFLPERIATTPPKRIPGVSSPHSDIHKELMLADWRACSERLLIKIITYYS